MLTVLAAHGKRAPERTCCPRCWADGKRPSVDTIRSVRGRLKHLSGKGTVTFLDDRHRESMP